MIKLLLELKARKNISSVDSSLRDFSVQNNLNNSTRISKVQVPGRIELPFHNKFAIQPMFAASKSKKNPLAVTSQQIPQAAFRQRLSKFKDLDQHGSKLDESQAHHRETMKNLDANADESINNRKHQGPNTVKVNRDDDSKKKVNVNNHHRRRASQNPTLIKTQDTEVEPQQQQNPDTVKSDQLPAPKRENFLEFILKQRKLKAGHFGS